MLSDTFYIIRGMHRINIPGANVRLFPGDTIQVIGTDNQLAEFRLQVERVSAGAKEKDILSREMFLKQWAVDEKSPFIGLSLYESGIRSRYHCLVVGIEKVDGELHSPDSDILLEAGDIVWVVGEEKDVYRLLSGEIINVAHQPE